MSIAEWIIIIIVAPWILIAAFCILMGLLEILIMAIAIPYMIVWDGIKYLKNGKSILFG